MGEVDPRFGAVGPGPGDALEDGGGPGGVPLPGLNRAQVVPGLPVGGVQLNGPGEGLPGLGGATLAGVGLADVVVDGGVPCHVHGTGAEIADQPDDGHGRRGGNRGAVAPRAEAVPQPPPGVGRQHQQDGQHGRPVAGAGEEGDDARRVGENEERRRIQPAAMDGQGQAKEGERGDEAEGEGHHPLPEGGRQDRGVAAPVVDALVAALLVAVEEAQALARLQGQEVQGLLPHVLQGLVPEVVGAVGAAVDAGLQRLGHEVVPLPPGPDPHQALVVGAVADVEIDARVVGDEDPVAADGVVAPGRGQDRRAHPEEKEGAAEPRRPLPGDPGRRREAEAEHRRHRQGREAVDQTRREEGRRRAPPLGAQQQQQAGQAEHGGQAGRQDLPVEVDQGAAEAGRKAGGETHPRAEQARSQQVGEGAGEGAQQGLEPAYGVEERIGEGSVFTRPST